MHLMEIDIILTRDNHLVLAHAFRDFRFTPTLAEFKKSRASGNTTRMSFQDLIIFMENNKDLYVITDTKYDDIYTISREFEKMTSVLKNHTELII